MLSFVRRFSLKLNEEATAISEESHAELPSRTKPGRRKRILLWIAAIAAVLIVSLVIVANVMLHRAGPILRRRVIDTLSARFHSRVELDELNASVIHGLEISGDRLRIFPPEDMVTAGVTLPLIAVDHFSFHAGVFGLLLSPTHVRTVQVTGLQINIPPREMRSSLAQVSPSAKKPAKVKIVLDEIICNNSQLVIGTAKPDKDPKIFELKHIELHHVGDSEPWTYVAQLTNAIPRGEIHAEGHFGPWQVESPGDSSVSGHYTFDHADLNTIRGIGGILSSVGDFKGQLNRIEIDGTTNTPDFSLDSANHPLPLRTTFHAIVDGTSGDTYLQPVSAVLRDSSFTTSGSVINIKGRGHVIELDVDIPHGRLQDFLDLAVKTKPPVMSAVISTKTKLHIRPGKERVVEKLSLQGAFTLQSIHFTNPAVQDKVDMMSERAQGEPKKARPGAKDVTSRMTGQFALNAGAIKLSELDYAMPGVRVALDGVYTLDGQQFDFRGKVQTDASLSQMVDNRWLSLVLKAVPFFRRKGGGTEIPVRISGTQSAPKFGLDVLRRHSDDNLPAQKEKR